MNALHCPDLIKPLLRICSEFPLWSAVMVPHFKSPNLTATSARVEGYFSTLKSSILTKKMSRMRVDKFLVTHIKSIRGDLKIAASHNNNETLSSKVNINADEWIPNTEEVQIVDKQSNSDEIFDYEDVLIDEKSSIESDEKNAIGQDFLNDDTSSSSDNINNEEIEIENWKNKAYLQSPPPKKIKRSKYLSSHPEIKIKQKINQQIVKHRLDIIKNGNLVGTLSIGLNKNKEKCKITNTCAFDSLLQAVATAYLDSQEYAKYIDTNNCSILNIASKLVLSGTNNQLYIDRFELLREHAKKNLLVGNLSEYDARANVALLTEKLFIKAPSIHQFYTCDNFKCGQTIKNISLFPIDQEKLVTGINKINAIISNLNWITKTQNSFLGSFKRLQDAINMVPSQLDHYTRKCYRDGCDGTITVTKELGQHLFIEINIDTFNQLEGLKCLITDIPENIQVNKTE